MPVDGTKQHIVIFVYVRTIQSVCVHFLMLYRLFSCHKYFAREFLLTAYRMKLYLIFIFIFIFIFYLFLKCSWTRSLLPHHTVAEIRRVNPLCLEIEIEWQVQGWEISGLHYPTLVLVLTQIYSGVECLIPILERIEYDILVYCGIRLVLLWISVLYQYQYHRSISIYLSERLDWNQDMQGK